MSTEFIHGLSGLEPRHRGCVATIGSFDGVHLGHASVIQQVIESAEKRAIPSLAMVFEPQPNEYFAKQLAPARLMRLREKVTALHAKGIQRVLCLKFDQSLRSLTAQEFIDKILVNGIGVEHLIIGDDFRFGCDRAGDFALLLAEGEKQGFSVSDTHTFASQNERVSSTRIRQLLEQDRLEEAKSLLGKPYSVTGRVFHGKKLGGSIGFPTANIGLGRFHSPVSGVYAVTVSLQKKGVQQKKAELFQGVANVGQRPTVSGDKRTLLEVHLFDFNDDLYGQCLEVTFEHKIRAEQRFDGIEALTAQIAKDAARARQFFAES